ncbi:glycosyl hydrolase family 28-related protein [Cohnella yongneupensis]|uniref:Glycosyl hydrolase family 28-related protein n=1 Tax=Cohnella yongneupensis TaxID=425006 RepID=A0ABW0R2T2_9BACL
MAELPIDRSNLEDAQKYADASMKALEEVYDTIDLLYSEMPVPATTMPLPDGKATPGTSEAYARADHVHPASGGGSGGGDMLKSVYDKNNNGIVDQAEKLQFAKTISLTGDASGSVAFDGSANVAIQTTLASAGVVPGTYKSVTVDTKGRVTAGTNPTTLAGFGITDAAPSSHVGAGGSAHAIVSTNAAGFMSVADKIKLDNLSGGGGGGGGATNTGTVNVKDYGAKGDGVADDTVAIRNAIAYAESSGNLNVLFPGGTYKITDTIKLAGTTGLHLSGYGAIVKGYISDVKSVFELATTSANWWKGRRTVIEGIRISSNSNGTGIGIFVNQAQEWYLHNVHIEYFRVGLQLSQTWYGGVGGVSSLMGNIIGVNVIGEETNTIDFHNLKISSDGVAAGVVSTAVSIEAIARCLKYQGCTIEGYAYGFVYKNQTPGDSALLHLMDCYFEAIKTCAIDFSQKSEQTYVYVDIDNCYFAEDNKDAWIKIYSGNYRIFGNGLKDNKIYIRNDTIYRVNLNTDVKYDNLMFAEAIGNGDATDGLMQLNGDTNVFINGNVYLYNPKGDYNNYPTSANHLPSVIDQQPLVAISPYNPNELGKVYNVYTVNYKDLVFEKNGVVLKSPNGRYFRLTVSDTGVISTKDVTDIKETFAPSISSVPILEVGRREVRRGEYAYPDGTIILISEINRKFRKVTGKFEDTAFPGKTALGTGVVASTTTFAASNIAYFYNTDIEYFYVWSGSVWAWSGTGANERTTIRSLGTLAQRPSTPQVGFMKYYGTDTKVYYTWNGSAWS